MTNGEKYKSVKERTEAFEAFCDSHGSRCDGCPLIKACDDGSQTFAWLELEAAEEKPLPCPFCEHSVNIVRTGMGVLSCKCTCCTYSSSDYDNADEAIAAHNRVARAVMADKDKANDKEAK